MSTETLTPDVGWEPSGHLSEVALSAAADGEEGLLDAGMQAHLEGCDGCAQRLGEVALRSVEVGAALGQVSALGQEAALLVPPAREARAARAREPRRVPMMLIAAALGLALLGVAPSLLSAPGELEHGWSVVRKVAPSFVRLLPQAMERAWSVSRGAAVIVVWGLAAMLVATGFGIAKRASKKALVNGEQQ